MGTALSSWKEIAQYVGKGVRTVQRREREAGLPVRRPQGEGKGKVLAFPGEIDGWMRTVFTRNDDGEGSELDALRDRVEQLLAENQRLRRELNAVSGSMAASVSSNGSTDESLLRRCERLLQESARTRQAFAQLVATHSCVTQACADTIQRMKSMPAFLPEDVFFHDAD
jgi:hypothetical protein